MRQRHGRNDDPAEREGDQARGKDPETEPEPQPQSRPLRRLQGVAIVDPHGVWIGFEEHTVVLAGVVGGDDLLFEQEEHHAERNKIFGNVPELGADVLVEVEVGAEFGDGEDGGPGKQPKGDGDGSTGKTAKAGNVDQADDEVHLSQEGGDADIHAGILDAPE